MIDTEALVRVHNRLESIINRPPLYHAVWSHQRLINRRNRVRRWMGPAGLIVAQNYAKATRHDFEHNISKKRKWRRWRSEVGK